jgi:dihydropyrimidine dehydrogenase (NAD+) subunit PreT
MVEKRNDKKLNRSQALWEARRCLGCHNAPCVDACPARVPIPDFIRRISEDNLPGASQLIYNACPLGNVCGTACPTAELCEGSCVLLPLGESAVRIGALQAYATEHAPLMEVKNVIPTAPRGAVIGGGPAGLGAAVQLNRLGVEVDLYERQDHFGGQAGTVIPVHHLPQPVVNHDLLRIQAGGIRFYKNNDVNEETIREIMAKYHAVILAVGQQANPDAGIAGTESQGVFSALDFLAKARAANTDEGTIPLLGSTVVVIGGGNVALDAAAVAKRSGAMRVIVLYRRGLEEMPAWEYEYIEACELGVEFRWFSVAEQITSQNGKVSGVTVRTMRYSSKMKDGRRWVEVDPKKKPVFLDCNAVILGIGQASEMELPRALGVGENKGLVTVNGYQTANPKVFAAGEIMSGGSSIVASMASGMKAAREAHAWMVREGIARG